MTDVPTLLRRYDISLPLYNGLAHWPGDASFHFRQDWTIDAGESVNVGTLTMSVHSGTHVDAPAHFRGGGGGASEIPLDVLVGWAQVVDASGHDAITADVFDGVDFTETPRVLVRTGGWTDYGTFPVSVPTLTTEAVLFLAARGVVLFGVDVPSVDAIDSKDLPNHHRLDAAGITILEGLDLRDVPPGRYHLTALPLRLVGADGAPVRAILTAGPDAI